jgi:hypothetical protein
MIPVELVVFLGILVCLREFYKVAHLKRWKNLGSLFSFGYFTCAYLYIMFFNPDIASFQKFIRIGYFLIVLDKTMVSFYEIFLEGRKRYLWI